MAKRYANRDPEKSAIANGKVNPAGEEEVERNLLCRCPKPVADSYPTECDQVAVTPIAVRDPHVKRELRSRTGLLAPLKNESRSPAVGVGDAKVVFTSHDSRRLKTRVRPSLGLYGDGNKHGRAQGKSDRRNAIHDRLLSGGGS
jgi:hypothetical protein